MSYHTGLLILGINIIVEIVFLTYIWWKDYR